jgi:hypothetical protein
MAAFCSDGQINCKAFIPKNAIDKGVEFVDERAVSANQSIFLSLRGKKRFLAMIIASLSAKPAC